MRSTHRRSGAAGVRPDPRPADGVASAGRAVSAGIARIVDLALPPRCVGCQDEGAVLCPACEAGLYGRDGIPPGVPIGMASHVPLPIVAHEWCTAYGGIGRPAIHALKYGGERRLAEPLGRAMAHRWRQVRADGEILVPLPVHASRRRERGYDQAELLAVVVGHHLGVPVVPALVRNRATVRQAELDHAARASNVRGAFVLSDGAAGTVSGRWAILVDDVMTTGATLAAAAETLLAADAIAVSALTLARER
jgi:ComF family protein